MSIDPDKQAWERYEHAAREILEKLRSEPGFLKLGLAEVEGKQKVQGNTGVAWEVDAKGIVEGSTAFVIIECRRHTTSKLKQEDVAGLAFRVKDTGASGALLVSPLGLQEGGLKVAAASSVYEVRLPADCTLDKFVVSFLGNLYVSLQGAEAKAEAGFVAPTTAVKLRSKRNGS